MSQHNIKRKKKMHDRPPVLILNNEIFEEKIFTKFLGLRLDRNLCFQEHINYVEFSTFASEFDTL